MVRKEKVDRIKLHTKSFNKKVNRVSPQQKKLNKIVKMEDILMSQTYFENRYIRKPQPFNIAGGRKAPTSLMEYFKGTTPIRLQTARILNQSMKKKWGELKSHKQLHLMHNYFSEFSKLGSHKPNLKVEGLGKEINYDTERGNEYDPTTHTIHITSTKDSPVALSNVFAHELYHSRDKTLNINGGKANRQDREDAERILQKHNIKTNRKYVRANGDLDIDRIYRDFHGEFRIEKRANKFGLWGTKHYLTDSMRLHKLHPRARSIHNIVAPIRKSVRKLK